MYAVDVANIGELPIPKRIKEMIVNDYNYKRSGAIQIINEPGYSNRTINMTDISPTLASLLHIQMLAVVSERLSRKSQIISNTNK